MEDLMHLCNAQQCIFPYIDKLIVLCVSDRSMPLVSRTIGILPVIKIFIL